jgi:hypothetical protein
MGYGVRHADGSSDENVPVSSFGYLYDELDRADGEHGDVAVIDDDTGWCITAYPRHLVIFQCLANGTSFHMRDVDRSQVMKMWALLAQGAIEDIQKLPWKDGFR